MEIDISYNYLNLLAFANLLKYENRRSISLEVLENYHEVMANEVLDLANELKEATIDCYGSLEEFLSEYHSYFYQDGDNLCLYDDVTYDELCYLMKDFDIDDANISLMERASEFPYPLGTLGIHTLHDVLMNFLKTEREIYHQYQNNSFHSKKDLLMRAVFYHNLQGFPHYVIEALRNDAWYIAEDDYSYNYQIFPVNREVFKYYLKATYGTDEINTEEQNIENHLYDSFQYAIFGTSTLIYTKLELMLDQAYETVEPNRYEDEEIEDINFDETFYLYYLAMLEAFFHKYGVNRVLSKVKNRLLYLLDMPDKCLFKEENLNMAIEEVLDRHIVSDEIPLLRSEVYFLANEVFIVEENNFTIRKLLFIGTYYGLTGDPEIKNIIQKYQNHPLYFYYTDVIFMDRIDPSIRKKTN